MRTTKTTAIGIIVLGLYACTHASVVAPPGDINAVDAAMIFGYVEADEGPIEQVDIYEYGSVYVQPFAKPPGALVYDNGIFMVENIKPGKYIIAGFRSDTNHYDMIRSARQTYQRVLHIHAGELRYAGSFYVQVTEKGVLNYGHFSVTSLQRPGERDILRRLYEVTEGTGWQNKIERRLKELRQ